MRRAWRFCVRHEITIVFLLVLGVIAWGSHVRSDQQSTMRHQQRELAAQQLQMCHGAQQSWDQRRALIETFTAPSKLSSDVDPTSPEGRALEKQVAEANAHRLEQRAHLESLDGSRPKCDS